MRALVSRIIKIEVGIMIILSETLIILDITKTITNNNCFLYIEHNKMDVMFLLLHQQQATQSIQT